MLFYVLGGRNASVKSSKVANAFYNTWVLPCSKASDALELTLKVKFEWLSSGFDLCYLLNFASSI